jgi:hypothetical protein
MALIETVAGSLGPAIAKGIIKVWLKDRSIATEVGSQVVDLLKSTISDALGRQRAARQFEAMGQQVAETLIPIFEIEGAKIPDGSRAAVAFAVAESLTSAAVNSKLVVDASVDAEQLAKLLKETQCKSAVGFSEAELSLHGRILDELARNIIDVADNLPAFDQRVYAEILRKESELLRLTDEALRELQQLRAISEKALSSGEDPQFENEYRRTVVRKLDLLQLFGIKAQIKQQKLRVAYISLSVRTSTEVSPVSSPSSNKPSVTDAEDTDTISVEKLLAKSSRYWCEA